MNPYTEFKKRFKLLVSKERHLVVNTLSNIFTMRLIGNKTHGDLAEIGIAEFINQFMYDFKSKHVGKDLFKSKEQEEDILIVNELTQKEFPVSLKAYGDGPLQLSTDKNGNMFPFLLKQGKIIKGKKKIEAIFKSAAFKNSSKMNIMPLIYKEKEQKCNILVFDYKRAESDTAKIIFIDKGKKFTKVAGVGKVQKVGRRKHPIYMFLDKNDDYICEIRYGGKDNANALQRGFWTETKKAVRYFDSMTNGWIDYSHNKTLVRLFSLALNSTEKGHAEANNILQKDIDNLKQKK